jgi:hypothetical protein
MNTLTYDSRDGNYHGTQSDGTSIVVDGDVYAEQRQIRITDGMSFDQADNETADPDGWSLDMDGCWTGEEEGEKTMTTRYTAADVQLAIEARNYDQFKAGHPELTPASEAVQMADDPETFAVFSEKLDRGHQILVEAELVSTHASMTQKHVHEDMLTKGPMDSELFCDSWQKDGRWHFRYHALRVAPQ